MNDEQLIEWIVLVMPIRFSIMKLKETMKLHDIDPPASCRKLLDNNEYKCVGNMWTHYKNVKVY